MFELNTRVVVTTTFVMITTLLTNMTDECRPPARLVLHTPPIMTSVVLVINSMVGSSRNPWCPIIIPFDKVHNVL